MLESVSFAVVSLIPCAVGEIKELKFGDWELGYRLGVWSTEGDVQSDLVLG